MPVDNSQWLSVLQAEVNKSTKSEVARKIGVSRTAISLALAGKYVGRTDRLASRVMETFAEHQICPHLQQAISDHQCRSNSSRPIPQSSAEQLRHWRACQTCALNWNSEAQQ